MSNDLARLRYQCRRGMLELDAILQPFFEKHFLNLSADKQKTFEQLLTYSDQALYLWFIGSERPQDPALASLINEIKTLR